MRNLITETIRVVNGDKYHFKKKDGKFRCCGRVNADEPAKPRPKPIKPKPPASGYKESKKINRLPDRIVDESKYIWVRRNNKTMVQVLKPIPDKKRKAS